MCWAQITQDLSTKWKLINSNLAKIQKINLTFVDLYFDPEDMSYHANNGHRGVMASRKSKFEMKICALLLRRHLPFVYLYCKSCPCTITFDRSNKMS